MASSYFNRFGIITVIFAWIISTVLNILYRREYFQMGVNFIYSYQSSSQTGGVTVIQNLISILGNTFFIVAFLIVVHLLTYRKLYSIVYIFYISCNAYLIAVEKQAYQDPRPFFYDARIQALEWSCPKSYGFPSGHSWISILLYEPIISDLIGTGGWKKLILVWILFTGTLIPISRQYLGSHTADQVTSGVLHSMCALILYKCHFQSSIYRLISKTFQGVSLKITLIINTICFLISIAVPFIIYSYNVNNKIFDPIFLASMNSTCGKNYTQTDLEKEAGTAASIIGLVFGFIYGFALVNYQKFANIFILNNETATKNIYVEYMKGNWSFRGRCVNGFKFILLYILFGGVFVGVIAYGIPAGFNNFYGTYILQTIGYCLFGVAIVCLIPFLLVKLQTIEIKQSKGIEVQAEVKTNEHFTPKVLQAQQ